MRVTSVALRVIFLSCQQDHAPEVLLDGLMNAILHLVNQQETTVTFADPPPGVTRIFYGAEAGVGEG